MLELVFAGRVAVLVGFTALLVDAWLDGADEGVVRWLCSACTIASARSSSASCRTEGVLQALRRR